MRRWRLLVGLVAAVLVAVLATWWFGQPPVDLPDEDIAVAIRQSGFDLAPDPPPDAVERVKRAVDGAAADAWVDFAGARDLQSVSCPVGEWLADGPHVMSTGEEAPVHTWWRVTAIVADGVVHVAAPPGVAEVDVQAGDGSVRLSWTPGVDRCDARPVRSAEVSGTVVGIDGKPVPGGMVWCGLSRFSFVDQQGTFRLLVPEDGFCGLQAASAGTGLGSPVVVSGSVDDLVLHVGDEPQPKTRVGYCGATWSDVEAWEDVLDASDEPLARFMSARWYRQTGAQLDADCPLATVGYAITNRSLPGWWF